MKRYTRTGASCRHCGGQIVRFQGGAVCCLACNREPDEPRRRLDPDAEAGRPDPVRRRGHGPMAGGVRL